MLDPTISAGFAHGLTEYCVAHGANREQLLAGAGIDASALADHFNRIPLTRYIALMRTGKVLCNDPALAVHFGVSSNCTDLSLISMIAAASDSVMMAFQLLNRYGRLSVDVDGIDGPDHFPIEITREGAWLIDNRQHHGLFPELAETTLARFAANIPKSFGPQAVRAIHFSHCAPDHHLTIANAFSAPVRYGACRTAILLDPAVVHARMAPSPRYALGVLTAHADQLMRDLEGSRSTRGRVESAVLPILHTGDVSMERVAQSLAMSRPTLYRKLKMEEVTFEEVLDGVRHRMALHHLASPSATVNDVSHLVGFSDPAAFSRAFKRWTGSSPRARARAQVA